MDFQLNQAFVRSYTVSTDVYEAFQKCSADYNPLHTDEAFARERGFPGKVMYGNILNAFLSHFIGECLPMKNVIIHSQSIAFKNPVFLDEVLSFEAVVTGVFDAVQAIEFKFKFQKPDGKPAAKGVIQIGVMK